MRVLPRLFISGGMRPRQSCEMWGSTQGVGSISTSTSSSVQSLVDLLVSSGGVQIVKSFLVLFFGAQAELNIRLSIPSCGRIFRSAAMAGL